MAEIASVLRQVDEEALSLARRLVRTARSAALAVNDPDGSGFPQASRVAVGMDTDGVPVILVSGLSAHTRALEGDGRCSMLFGEPGKGDPLAHPRITVRCRATRVDHMSDDQVRLRARFLRRHPKAALYADLPDFRFFRLSPVAASLNGGFGRAYSLAPEAFLIVSPARREIEENEERVLMEWNRAETHSLKRLVTLQIRDPAKGWVAVGLDAAGIDIGSPDRIDRVEFDQELQNFADLRAVLARVYG